MKVPHWKCSWCDPGTPLGFCWWAVCPSQSLFLLPESVSAGSPGGNRSLLPPFSPHPGPSLPARLPQCSGLLPSCYLLRSGLYVIHAFKYLNSKFKNNKFLMRISYRKQSCLVWRSAHKVQISQSPLCLAPDPPGLHEEHTYHLEKQRLFVKNLNKF